MAATKKPQSGFGDFDMTRFFDVEKMMGEMRMPGFDPNAMMEAQRKNIEALVQANKVAAEGFQALAQRQQDILREHVEQMQSFMRDSVSADTPEANAGRQAELMKVAFEKALQNMRELAELASKSQSEAFEIVNKRVVDSMEEFRRLADQKSGSPKG